jgi:hypothetical protein
MVSRGATLPLTASSYSVTELRLATYRWGGSAADFAPDAGVPFATFASTNAITATVAVADDHVRFIGHRRTGPNRQSLVTI